MRFSLKILDISQYAYQSGKSAETALHHLVRRVEGTLSSNSEYLAAFLDIEGAFDTSFDVICGALAGQDVEPRLLEWIRCMLSQRSIQAGMLTGRSFLVTLPCGGQSVLGLRG